MKFVIAAVVLVVMCSTPAGADPASVVSPIQAGATGTPVGTATFTRINNADGTETLTVNLVVPGGMNEDHLCLRATAFTSRISPGQCQYIHDLVDGDPNDDFVVNLGTTYVGQKLYAQLHVSTTAGQTAYAGWKAAQQGGAFYGNVEIDPSAIPGVPAAPLLGDAAPVAVALAFAAGAGLVVWRRTRRGAIAEPH